MPLIRPRPIDSPFEGPEAPEIWWEEVPADVERPEVEDNPFAGGIVDGAVYGMPASAPTREIGETYDISFPTATRRYFDPPPVYTDPLTNTEQPWNEQSQLDADADSWDRRHLTGIYTPSGSPTWEPPVSSIEGPLELPASSFDYGTFGGYVRAAEESAASGTPIPDWLSAEAIGSLVGRMPIADIVATIFAPITGGFNLAGMLRTFELSEEVGAAAAGAAIEARGVSPSERPLDVEMGRDWPEDAGVFTPGRNLAQMMRSWTRKDILTEAFNPLNLVPTAPGDVALLRAGGRYGSRLAQSFGNK